MLVFTLGITKTGENMRFLNWNQRKVKDLSPWEIWAFIAGRVLMSFGIGVLAMCYFPQVAFPLASPMIVIGVVLLLFAFKGFFRRKDLPPK
jgi:hypothetical protein